MVQLRKNDNQEWDTSCHCKQLINRKSDSSSPVGEESLSSHLGKTNTKINLMVHNKCLLTI